MQTFQAGDAVFASDTTPSGTIVRGGHIVCRAARSQIHYGTGYVVQHSTGAVAYHADRLTLAGGQDGTATCTCRMGRNDAALTGIAQCPRHTAKVSS